MSTYYDHADSAGADIRRLALASNSDRAMMLKTLAERDMGCVTLTMSAAAIRARLREAGSIREYGYRRWMPVHA